MKKDEEREFSDPHESIEETPTVNFHQVSSKSDFREPSFDPGLPGGQTSPTVAYPPASTPVRENA